MYSTSTEMLLPPLCAGAAAGMAVDVSLFPVDTVKTRLQSAQGFRAAGGFSGLYKGVGPVLLASAPGASLFFLSYETLKSRLAKSTQFHETFNHMAAASVGELVACTVRVPCEVVKQRAQAGGGLSRTIFLDTLRKDSFRGLYRGFRSTVIREVPFSFIQFPLWEYLKSKAATTASPGEAQEPLSPWKSGLCGAVAGSIAAALTTPLDVAKTRIMLAARDSSLASGSVTRALTEVWTTKGLPGLFAGVVPRVLWISIGGAIFLGTYDGVSQLFLVHDQLAEDIIC